MKIIQTTLKKSLLLSMVILLLLSLSPALAAKQKTNVSISNSELNEPVIFQKEILATDEGEKFQVGFVRIDFKKDFIEEENLPITFEIKVYAENGEVYIEFNPSVDVFNKDVKVHASNYSGYIYDIATGKNIYVEIPNQTFKVEHFSRYCFAW